MDVARPIGQDWILLTGVPLTEAFRVCVRVVPVRFGMWVWQFLSSARTGSSDRGMILVAKCCREEREFQPLVQITANPQVPGKGGGPRRLTKSEQGLL